MNCDAIHCGLSVLVVLQPSGKGPVIPVYICKTTLYVKGK